MSRLPKILGAACCAWLCVAGCRSRDAGVPSGEPGAGSVTVLATLAEEAPRSAGEPLPTGLGMHANDPLPVEFIFGERGGVAWVDERDGEFSVVHDGRAGKRYDAVGKLALSPDGRRCAYGALADGKWRMVVDGKEGAPFSTVKDPVFSPDGAHLAYQAMAGERWHLVVDERADAGTRGRYLWHDFSGDASRIAFTEATGGEEVGRLVVSDLSFRSRTVVDGRVLMALTNAARSRVAAISERDGRQRLVTFGFDRPDRVVAGPPSDNVFRPAFGPDGVSVSYVALRSGSVFVVLDGREERLEGAELVSLPAVRPDGRAVGALVASDGEVKFRQFFEKGGDEPAFDEAEGLVYTPDGRRHAYAARQGERWHLVVNGVAGPPFDRVVTPSFSPDGTLVAYRARQDGVRFVVVADASGKTLRQHASLEQVFPVAFTADGKSIAYGAKLGRQLLWRVEAP